MNYKTQLAGLGGVLSMAFGAYQMKNSCIYYVNTGEKAFKFSKLTGVKMTTVKEGYHLKTPWLENEVIYNVKSQPTKIDTMTGSKDLQQVRIALRVLYRPDPTKLQTIYRNLGKDYDQRVLPSVVNECLKQCVAQYNASNLLVQREKISGEIRANLIKRLLDFNIILDDVSIVDLVFG